MEGRAVLVVDDDPQICDLVASVAENVGIKAVAAHNRDQFLARYLGHKPGIIVLDLMMPGCDGIELLRYLAENGCRAKIVLASGADPRVLATAQRLGSGLGLSVIATLSKPFDIGQLKAVLGPIVEGGHTIDKKDLEAAIFAGQVVPYFQPKVSLRNGTGFDIAACEALARWNHPKRGLVPPDEFIPLAEKSGLIASLTDRVLGAAIAQASDWRDKGLTLSISANVSPFLLGDLLLPDRIEALAESHGVPAAAIVLEITESGAMADATASMDILTRFRLKGFGLSLDDFGTGYSSLVQLHRLPFNEMKIDKSFVREIGVNREAEKIVRSIAGLAGGLGLNLCAEGIETNEALDFLRALECDTGQGYLIGKPMPADEFFELARNRRTASIPKALDTGT
jgi:EAL domain-containing protein (putative c-di-GMP-specific phosphodiesterase class I)/ActR/RegA family two-component response regulator